MREIIMDEKILLILNPVAGEGASKLWVYDMIEILSKKYDTVSVHISKCAGDIKKAAFEHAAEYDAVVCAGGDGTLSEMIDGVVSSGASPLLGYMPIGTTNDFANGHGISRNLKTAMKRFVEGDEHYYDVGVLGERPFAYVAAFGAFTDVAYQTAQDKKTDLGIIAYLIEAAKRLPEMKSIHLSYEIDGKTESGDFIYGMVSNSKNVSGMKFFDIKDENLSDGEMEITLVRFPKNVVELQTAIKGLLNPKIKCATVIRATASKVRFSFDNEVAWTTDGEYGGDYKDVEVSVLPERMHIKF